MARGGAKTALLGNGDGVAEVMQLHYSAVRLVPANDSILLSDGL
jgi:hypothetical protein